MKEYVLDHRPSPEYYFSFSDDYNTHMFKVLLLLLLPRLFLLLYMYTGEIEH